ncbi:tripartite motif-containing protein 3-like [Saccoglossus kowalevskii]
MAVAASNMINAEEILTEVGEDFLSCSICKDRYNNPKILPCHHTFCQECLIGLATQSENNTLTCPTCGSKCQYRGERNLKPNIFMISLLGQVPKKKKEVRVVPNRCEHCEENQVSYICTDCDSDQYCCKSCSKAHTKLKFTRSHRVLPIDEFKVLKIKNPASFHPINYCSMHTTNELHYYCNTCNVAICLECTVIDHRVPQHSHRNLKDVVKDCTTDLEKMVAKLKDKASEAEKNEMSARDTCKLVKALCEQETGKVQRKADEIEQILKRKSEDSIQSVKIEETQLVGALSAEYNKQAERQECLASDLEIKHGHLSSMCSYVEMLMHCGNPIHILKMENPTKYYANKILTVETNPKIHYEVMEFQSMGNNSIKLGVLRSDTEISLCSVTGVPTQLQKGDHANILIRAKDREGKQVISRQEVQAQVLKPNGSWVDGRVVNNNDGTYNLMLTGQSDGIYQVKMTIGQQPIPRTPVQIPVKKGLVKIIGKEGTLDGQFQHPCGIAINKHGNYVAADGNNCRVQIIDGNGNCKKVLKFTKFERSFIPFDIAISNDDKYFMTDAGNNQIVVSDENGKVFRCFGQKELRDPCGIAISPLDGAVYVTEWDRNIEKSDKEGHCIKKFKQNGEFIKVMGNYGNGRGQFKGPYFISIDCQGMMFVTEYINDRIQVFSSDNRPLYFFGRPGKDGGAVHGPRGIAIDRNRYIYVCDCTNRIHKFDSGGRFIAFADGDLSGLDHPVGLALTNDTPSKVVVADKKNNCIQSIRSVNVHC